MKTSADAADGGVGVTRDASETGANLPCGLGSLDVRREPPCLGVPPDQRLDESVNLRRLRLRETVFASGLTERQWPRRRRDDHELLSLFTTAWIRIWSAESAGLPLRKCFDTILGVRPSTVAVASAPVAPHPSSTRSRQWRWESSSSLRSGTEVSKREQIVALAVCFPSGKAFHRSAVRRNASASHFGKESSKRGQAGDPRDRRTQTGQLPYVQAQFRDSLAGKWSGYSYVSGAAWAPGRFHDDDLHACSEQTRPRHSEPA